MMKHMITQDVHLPNITALADRLLTDIRRRGLAVGDRYLTTAEVSRMLGIRKAVAVKAIRQLAEREILIPRQRTGTFVGPGLGNHKRSKVRTIYVLLPAGDLTATHWPYQPFIAGVHSAIPEINVQFTFIPENDSVAYVRDLIDGSQAAGQFAGVVAVSCPPEVYRFLAELCVPAVVYGTLYSTDLAIASVDIDSFQCGRLLTKYLIGRGHRRMGLLMTRGGRPGDHVFFDGISEALSAAGLPHNALIQRLNHSTDIEAFRATAKDLLLRADRPTAIITRGSIQGGEVAEVAAGIGLAVPDQLEIAFDHSVEISPHVDLMVYPRVVPKWSFVEIAGAIGKLLKERSEASPARPQHVLVPVELQEPKRKE